MRHCVHFYNFTISYPSALIAQFVERPLLEGEVVGSAPGHNIVNGRGGGASSASGHVRHVAIFST